MLDQSQEGVLAKLRPSLESEPFPDRRLGRALAFQVLYEADLAQHSPNVVFERGAETVWQEAFTLNYPNDLVRGGLSYARELVEGALRHRQEIDSIIQARAAMFPLAQMSAVDRNVLRLGLYESLFGGGRVPMRAAINEAVELAKLFGSESSAKFVNGVLGRAVETHPAGRASGAEPGKDNPPAGPAQAETNGASTRADEHGPTEEPASAQGEVPESRPDDE